MELEVGLMEQTLSAASFEPGNAPALSMQTQQGSMSVVRIKDNTSRWWLAAPMGNLPQQEKNPLDGLDYCCLLP